MTAICIIFYLRKQHIRKKYDIERESNKVDSTRAKSANEVKLCGEWLITHSVCVCVCVCVFVCLSVTALAGATRTLRAQLRYQRKRFHKDQNKRRNRAKTS